MSCSDVDSSVFQKFVLAQFLHGLSFSAKRFSVPFSLVSVSGKPDANPKIGA
jgi:hypothetical protein